MTTAQKFLLGLVLLLAVLIGILFVSGKSVQSPAVGPARTPSLSPAPSAPATRQVPKQPTITETDNVSIRNRAFSPSTISARAGALVTWTNFDLSPHTVTGRGFDSGVLSEGATWSQHFTKPGRYEYRCSVHPSMRGVIEVK